MTGRGRPRSQGKHQCSRCNRMVAKIRVTWPDGTVCGVCFKAAANRKGSCAQCGKSTLLPGQTTDGEPLCSECSGITTNFTCSTCGDEIEIYKNGNCARCSLAVSVKALLRHSDPPDLRVKRLADYIIATDRAESALSWMRLKAARRLLQDIGDRAIVLTPKEIDRLTPSNASSHLRQILITCGAVPDLRDVRLWQFDHWLSEKLATLGGDKDVASAVEKFAKWHHLRRINRMEIGSDYDNTVRNSKQEITETTKFLLWVKHNCEQPIDTITQELVDEYLSTGSSTRRHIRNYLQVSGISGKRKAVKVPPRTTKDSPYIIDSHRLRLIARLLKEHVPENMRVISLLYLIYGVRIQTLVTLKTNDLQIKEIKATIKLAELAVPLPALLYEIASAYKSALSSAPNRPGPWLFPSVQPGRHLHANYVWNWMSQFGIPPQGARNATLRDLASSVNPTTLSSVTGYAPSNIVAHSLRGSARMGHYANNAIQDR